MKNDPIVEEIRRYRKELSADYGNDLNRMVEALRKKEFESTRIQLNPGPKLLLKEQREKFAPKQKLYDIEFCAIVNAVLHMMVVT